jgi:PhoH-like ATPase
MLEASALEPYLTESTPDGGTFQRTIEPNQFVVLKDADDDNHTGLARRLADTEHLIPVTGPRKPVFGIMARNVQQTMALDLLLDDEIKLLTLIGNAGTGKTLLAVAAGMAKVFNDGRYEKLLVARPIMPLGRDIGFLPGTEEEKMTPWMGALMDNLEALAETQEGGEWGRAATADLLAKRVKVRSMNFMRGRTFFNRYIVIDEAQNLTAKQMRTLITRAGPGSKIVCCGNIAQIDTPYLSETTSGLTYIVDRFKQWEHGGHITLMRGERSRLADYAVQNL